MCVRVCTCACVQGAEAAVFMKRCETLAGAAVPCAAAVRTFFESLPVPSRKLEVIEHFCNSRPWSCEPLSLRFSFPVFTLDICSVHTRSASPMAPSERSLFSAFMWSLLQEVQLDFNVIGGGRNQVVMTGWRLPFMTSQRANFQDCY